MKTQKNFDFEAAASSAAAAALLVMVVARPAPPAPASPAVLRPGPLFVAVIQPKQGEPFSAVYDPQHREVRLSGTVAPPSGRDVELWAIGADGVPRAAGLLPRGGGRLSPRSEAVIRPGVTFALSIEPVGGSPKSTPTGPVVATGKLVAI